MAETQNGQLPTFAGIAAQRLADAGPRDKVINIKVAIATARMMVEAEAVSGRAPDMVRVLRQLVVTTMAEPYFPDSEKYQAREEAIGLLKELGAW